MGTSILLVGVGGQGTILTSKILSVGLVQLGYDVKMSEIHGMSQRGGSVNTQIKYGGKIYSPGIGLGEADFIAAFEKIEALRWLPYLKPDGVLITDSREIPPLPVLMGAAEYPSDCLNSLTDRLKNARILEAAKIAAELGAPRSQNIVLLGALVRMLDLDGVDWSVLITRFVPPKSKDANLNAFAAGREQFAI